MQFCVSGEKNYVSSYNTKQNRLRTLTELRTGLVDREGIK